MRRRANIACAELALTLMLVLARRVNELAGRISVKALADLGYHYQPFDRRHTPNSNWGRVPGLKILYGSTVGIIGLGEIGREFALRAAAFGMRILYTQRRQAPAEIEQQYQATLPADGAVARRERLGRAVRAERAGDGEPHRPRRAGADTAAARGSSTFRAPTWSTARRCSTALKSGHLGGFGLDPLYESPGRDDDELVAFPNVVMTPHIAAQPRFNALDDLEEMITGLARAVLRPSSLRANGPARSRAVR